MRVPLAQYPGMNRFVLDWMNGDERFLSRGGPALSSRAESRDPGGWGARDVPFAPPAQVPRLTLGMTQPTLHDALKESNKHWGIFASDAEYASRSWWRRSGGAPGDARRAGYFCRSSSVFA